MAIVRTNRPKVIVERSATQNPIVQVSPRVVVTYTGGGGGGGTPGANGRETQFRVSDGYIQWRYVGDANWINLLATTALQGAKGDPGEPGDDGTNGVGILSVSQISGNHAPGTSDTYRITLTSGSTFDFAVYNGSDGSSGDHTHGTGAITSGTFDPARLPAATEVAIGAVELATTTETATGTDTTRAVTPAGLVARTATDARTGLVELATNAETTTGTDTTRAVTPASLKVETNSAKSRTNHTGTQSADTIVDGTTNKVLTAAEKTKLGGVATGATANATDAALRDRATHTGTQTSSTISDFTEAAQDAVAAMLAGASGVTMSYNDAANTLTITGPGAAGLDVEAVRDAIGVAMVGAGLINIAVNDAADTITVSTTATQNDTDANLKNRANHTGSQPSSTISDLTEAVQDIVGGFIAAGTGASVNYNDAGNSLVISGSGAGSTIETAPPLTTFTVNGSSTVARPTTRADVVIIFITSDGLPPINALENDIWLNGVEGA